MAITPARRTEIKMDETTKARTQNEQTKERSETLALMILSERIDAQNEAHEKHMESLMDIMQALSKIDTTFENSKENHANLLQQLSELARAQYSIAEAQKSTAQSFAIEVKGLSEQFRISANVVAEIQKSLGVWSSEERQHRETVVKDSHNTVSGIASQTADIHRLVMVLHARKTDIQSFGFKYRIWAVSVGTLIALIGYLVQLGLLHLTWGSR